MVSDAELAQKLTDGDKDSEKAFVDRYGALLTIKLRSRLRSKEEIEDVRQEVFLRVVKQLHQRGGLEKPESFGAFVHSVCNRVLLELFRSRRRHPTPAADESERPEIRDAAPHPDDLLISDERKARVRRVLETMNPTDQLILRRVFFDEADRVAVCREFEVSQGHLRVLLHRAKARFRTAYSEAGEA